MSDFNLRDFWAENAKRQKDWREQGEVALLQDMYTAVEGLKSLGWREIVYCPKDGSHFLSISAHSTGVHECWYDGEWPDGKWWTADAGDIWPARPILWKPMPAEEGAASIAGSTTEAER